MASIQETLRSVLGADGNLSALVGDRIYPGQVPDDEAVSPWLFYAVPESTPFDELDDSAGVEVRSEVEFHALADTYGQAKAIIDATLTALNTYSGGQVRRAFWQGTSEETTEDGYHHSTRLVVWSTTAPVTAPWYSLNLDGGTPTSVYGGGLDPLDGGTPTSTYSGGAADGGSP